MEAELAAYAKLLPDCLGSSSFTSKAYVSGYELDQATFARLLFNLHRGKSPWRGIAAHESAARFEHVATILAEAGLIWLDQHKMRWELMPAVVEKLGGKG